MNVERVIREVTVRGSAPGMEGVARAYDQVAASSEKGAIAFDRTTKASEGVDRSLEKLRIRYQEGYKEQQKYAEAQETYRRAVEQGRLTQEQAAQELANVREQLNETSKSYLDVSEAANDNARSFGRSGIEIASTANHLKTAAVAAYALSPAFRRLVDPAIATGLRGIAAGAAVIGPTAASAAGAAVRGFAPLLSTFLSILLPIKLVVEAGKLLAAIFEIGAQKIKEFTDLAANAAASGVSADYFQRQAKGAEDLELKIGDATAALKKFKEQSESKLGGSDFGNRLDELTKAGNFKDNAGVAAYKQAVTVEEKYRAASDIISIAIEKGERLAGLDLAAKFLPPEFLERLRANGTLLRELQVAADEVKPVDLVSQEQIAYASELKRRMEDAKKTLNDFFKADFVDAGLKLQGIWTAIVEKAAEWVKALYDIVEIFKDIGRWITAAGNLPFWQKLTQFLEARGLAQTPAQAGITTPDQPGFNSPPQDSQFFGARDKLSALLSDRAGILRQMREVTETETKVRGDISRNVKQEVTARQEANDAVDRAINTLRRHVGQQEADAKAVGLGAGALARYRAEAAQTSAIAANNGKITEKQSRDFKALADDAEAAAVALAKAQVASQADFNRKTAFLSQEDVSIAQQLRGIYGNDVPAALASTEAAAIRVNTAFKEISDGLRDAGKSVFGAFLSGKNVVDALVQSTDRLAAKLADSAFDNLIGGLLSANPVQAGIGAVQAGASALLSAFGNNEKKKKQEAADREAYRQQLAGIDAFIAKANGQSSSLTDALAAARSELDGFVQQAAKVKDWAKVATLQDAYNKNVIRINNEFVEQQAAELKRRADSYKDRLFAASNDNTTLEGQLAAQERDFARQRADEAKADGQAINDLVAAQEAERLGIIKRFADEARDYLLGVVKSIKDYLLSLQLGANSTLDPRQRLDVAQGEFQRQYALAQGGNRESLNAITGIAEAYRDQAESYFGRTEAYASIVNQITSALTGLTLPGAVGGEFANRPPIATAPSSAGVAAVNDNATAASSDADVIGGAINSQTEVLAASIADLTVAVAAQQQEIARLTKQLSMYLATAA